MAQRREVDPAASTAALYAYRLRRHRDGKGWTQDALADRVGCTGDLISKIETAKRSATAAMSQQFDRIFQLDAYFAELQPLAARELALGWFRPYLDIEATARSLHVYDPMLINGLLQIEEYARVVLRGGNSADRVEQLVTARMARQAVLRREDPPWLVILLTEYAVRRIVGGPEVMRPQLERLLEAIREPNITIQIIPEDAPVYLGATLALLTFDGRPDAVYAENAAGRGEIIDQPRPVAELKVHFDLIRAAALPAAASEKLIRTILESV